MHVVYFCSSRRSRGTDPLLQQMALCCGLRYETSHHDTGAHGIVRTTPPNLSLHLSFADSSVIALITACHAIRLNGEIPQSRCAAGDYEDFASPAVLRFRRFDSNKKVAG